MVHSFTISVSILLTEAGDSNIHLSTNANNHLIVDLVTLFDDLKRAIKLFFKDLNAGKGEMQKNFKKGFAKKREASLKDLLDELDSVTFDEWEYDSIIDYYPILEKCSHESFSIEVQHNYMESSKSFSTIYIIIFPFFSFFIIIYIVIIKKILFMKI